MKSATGNAMLFNIVIVIVIVLITILVGSLSYTKAYKVKNMIISTIEENNGYDEAAKKEIYANLTAMGYRRNENGHQTCVIEKTGTGKDGREVITDNNDFRYCVEKRTTSKGTYYRVASYMYFDFPVIGQNLEYPVYGESKIFYSVFN